MGDESIQFDLLHKRRAVSGSGEMNRDVAMLLVLLEWVRHKPYSIAALQELILNYKCRLDDHTTL